MLDKIVKDIIRLKILFVSDISISPFSVKYTYF